MVRWWVLVHYSPDGAQSNFSCGYWGLVESQMNGITHVFIHSVVPNLFTHPSIHPFIHPSIPHALYARLLWVRLERNGFDLPAAIRTERPRFQQDGQKHDKDGPLNVSR